MTSFNPLEFLSAYWSQLVGCSALIVFLNRVYVVIRKAGGYASAIHDARVDQQLMMTNHLPHLQMGLDDVNETITKVNENLEMLRSDMKEHMQGLRDDLRMLRSKGHN